ncbi:MAG TPA: anti-sigma factor [Allosphingosinicella sp.]|nr:anti-sigma factor [Allosphingosinicella sp.]
MTDERPSDRDERDLLAAEHALGLLSGAERARAAALARSDPEFARLAGRWAGRLAPLLDEATPVAPPARLWAAIEARIGAPAAPPSNVVLLRRRTIFWRAYAAAATAIAASLAFILVTRPPATPPVQPPPAGAPLAATLAAADSPARLVATWEPASRSLIVAAAADMPSPAGRGHELWLIPAGGKPLPMGMMPRGRPMRMHVPGGMALREGAMLAVSVEPMQGSPTGLPTGPVIAAGMLKRV